MTNKEPKDMTGEELVDWLDKEIPLVTTSFYSDSVAVAENYGRSNAAMLAKSVREIPLRTLTDATDELMRRSARAQAIGLFLSFCIAGKH